MNPIDECYINFQQSERDNLSIILLHTFIFKQKKSLKNTKTLITKVLSLRKL